MSPFRVLVADPDSVFLAACRLLLVGRNILLLAASDASTCRESILREAPDLLVLDCDLLEACCADWILARESPSQPCPPTLFMVDALMLPEALLHCPGGAVIVKPVSPVGLATVIRSLDLARNSGMAEAADPPTADRDWQPSLVSLSAYRP